MSKQISASEISAMRELFADTRLQTREGILEFEKFIKSLPESLGEDPFPLYHTFADGLYSREIHLPAGHVLVGKLHRHESMVYMLKGRVLVADENGSRELIGPVHFVSKPGVKRVGYVLDDVVWIDIHATKATTIKEAEKEIFVDSYEDMIEELGFTVEQVRAISENENDLIKEPESVYTGLTEIRDSDIEGKGVFITTHALQGSTVGIARMGVMRTPIGRYANHSFEPNAEFFHDGSKVLIRTLRDVRSGEELTVDYREARKVATELDTQIKQTTVGWSACQA